ncbi:allantoate amidohydrolase [Leucobacter sp. CSA1]|uniref:Allantoate amidohydrolase n=1 Tax=Leucobacter chromiisoli TaxID=2796471 RepID=A0A934Q6D8_9MICO|nr:allantoate amidohydrolase [Leucobacter chromiisoli]MBK0417901.1 allantoate amidohydrolase [Leucobacter chromiisoli]
MSVTRLLADIEQLGRDRRSGGYYRPVFSAAELDLRSWFIAEAERRGLDVTTDRNGIIWAWWGEPQAGSVVTGSHLDSVPGGGAFDGPLGVAAALQAVDVLRERGVQPRRSLAVAVFPEEEGSRFGIACLGSRLLTGKLSADRARSLTDQDGNTLADVFAAGGLDPNHLGRDDEALGRIGRFVELHIEQGRGLIDLGRPIAVGSSILGHGRWRVSVQGQGNHAGTTAMSDRSDPVVAAAEMVGAVADLAEQIDDARATVGRFEPFPGGTNVIASEVSFWVDARHPHDETTRALVTRIEEACARIAAARGCTVAVTEESWSPTAHFDAGLTRELTELLPDAPVLRTGAGHDAGILAEFAPSAMLFTRNPSGISHSPEEYAEDADADHSAVALADVLEGMLR